MTKELSVRETQILRLIAEGKENREIAQALGISVRTVEAHRARIMLKLDLESVTDSCVMRSATESSKPDLTSPAAQSARSTHPAV